MNQKQLVEQLAESSVARALAGDNKPQAQQPISGSVSDLLDRAIETLKDMSRFHDETAQRLEKIKSALQRTIG